MKVNYFKYSKRTGQIVETGSCDSKNIPLEEGDIGVQEGIADHIRQKVVDNELVELPEDVIDKRLNKPSKWHRWDAELMDWIDVRPPASEIPPSIHEQLAAIWAGGEEMERMRLKMRDIKDKPAKPEKKEAGFASRSQSGVNGVSVKA